MLVIGPEFSGQDGNTTPAAASHALVVTVELVTPVEEVLFTTVTVQVTWNPAVIGKSGGLHCVIEGAVVVAPEAAGAEAMPRKATPANAVTAATAARRQCRTVRVLVLEINWALREPLNVSVACIGLERQTRRQKLREPTDNDDQADHTVGPPSSFLEINNRLRRTSEVPGILL